MSHEFSFLWHRVQIKVGVHATKVKLTPAPQHRMVCEDPSDRDDDGMPEPHIKPADRQLTDFPEMWPHEWLSDDALFSFRFYFTRVSQAFDKRYFKAGKRLTTKCNLYNNSATKLARHNLVR